MSASSPKYFHNIQKTRSPVAQALFTLCLFFCLNSLVGCGLFLSDGKSIFADDEPPTPSLAVLPPPVAYHEITLLPGHLLNVDFPYWPELKQNNLLVSQSGMISMPHLGNVVVVGLTITETQQKLSRMYNRIIRDPELFISLSPDYKGKFYVAGEVLAPGGFPLEATMTLVAGIASAGGFRNESANLSTVLLIRHHKKTRYVTSIDLSRLMSGQLVPPIYLSANDIILVPRTKIDRINQWLSQYILETIGTVGFGWSYHGVQDWVFSQY